MGKIAYSGSTRNLKCSLFPLGVEATASLARIRLVAVTFQMTGFSRKKFEAQERELEY